MIRLYMDHHVPMSVTHGLRRRGIDVLTAYEDGGAETDDDMLLARAQRPWNVFCTAKMMICLPLPIAGCRMNGNSRV